MKYTLEDAARLYREAKTLGLSGAELLSDPAAVVRDCNGIGADWMPAGMRDLCTKLNPVMELAACIHDRRYAIGGVSPGRNFADAEFLGNVQTSIEHKYRWYDPRRYIAMNRAVRYYAYLNTFGAIAYGGGAK